MNTKTKEKYRSPECEAMELKLGGVIALSLNGDWMEEDNWTDS